MILLKERLLCYDEFRLEFQTGQGRSLIWMRQNCSFKLSTPVIIMKVYVKRRILVHLNDCEIVSNPNYYRLISKYSSL